jgi:hypothetical protein
MGMGWCDPYKTGWRIRNCGIGMLEIEEEPSCSPKRHVEKGAASQPAEI